MLSSIEYEDFLNEYQFLKNNLWAEVHAPDRDMSILRNYDRVNKDLLVIGHSNALESLFTKNSKKVLESYEELHRNDLIHKFDKRAIYFEVNHHNPERSYDNCEEGVCGGEFGVKYCTNNHVYKEKNDEGELVYSSKSWYWTLSMFIAGSRGEPILIDKYDSRRCSLDLYGYFPVRLQGQPHDKELSRSSTFVSTINPNEELDWEDDSKWKIETVGTKLERYEKIGKHLYESLKLFNQLPASIGIYDKSVEAEREAEAEQKRLYSEQEMTKDRVRIDLYTRNEAKKSSALNAKWFLLTMVMFWIIETFNWEKGVSAIVLGFYLILIYYFFQGDLNHKERK